MRRLINVRIPLGCGGCRNLACTGVYAWRGHIHESEGSMEDIETALRELGEKNGFEISLDENDA